MRVGQGWNGMEREIFRRIQDQVLLCVTQHDTHHRQHGYECTTTTEYHYHYHNHYHNHCHYQDQYHNQYHDQYHSRYHYHGPVFEEMSFN